MTVKFLSMAYKDAQGISHSAQQVGDKVKVLNKQTNEAVTMEMDKFINSLPEGLKNRFLEKTPVADTFTSSRSEGILKKQLIGLFGKERVAQESEKLFKLTEK